MTVSSLRPFAVLFALILCLPLIACDDHDHDHDSGEEVSVPHDGTSATSDDGLVVISYETAAPLARTVNVFRIAVKNASDGTALTGAIVGLEVTSEAGEAIGTFAATEGEAGLHTSPAVDFPAAGNHLIKIHVSQEATGLHDHATFRVLVP